ncbi:gliding motility-associated peptidyl-prolyl isomerase GldI [Maribacter sp. 2210JD10-5]|uniref:gliding motility-associated peptidyl-prolyl isomerase GldI n=1 Tax=Maribacter sp. 2210JD10-5 TaxID=3386272 RepID=UPI0039BD39D6
MRNSLIILLFLGIWSCKGPEPRRPVQTKSGSFFKESIERSKKLLAVEEKRIQEIIKNDSLRHYTHSANGSWYHYHITNDVDTYVPKENDLVVMNYDLRTLDNDTIYSLNEIGTRSYKVDKEKLFPGLREAVKILKEGEKATFLFPSSIGFGYHGDDNKIGSNVPLKSTISILKIEKQEENVEN